METRDRSYATIRHHEESHPGTEPLFTFHHMGTFMSSIERQIRESITIENFTCDNILNGKGEWGENLVPQASFGTSETKQSMKLNRNARAN